MTFHWPYVLLALPVALAALLALFARSNRARRRLLSQFAAARLLPALLASYSPGLRRIKHVLVIAGVLLVVLALARPQWGYDWQQQRARGVDVIFAIDTSKSMLTQDVAPNRLERAKLAIMDLVEKMEGNRVGLVAFAGQSFLQCPLTLDYDAFRQSLEAIDTNTIARGGTNIAAGINEAAAALENSGNHKVIVLVTDGEDLEGQGISAAKSLRDQGVIIYTVGVGTPQGDIIPVTGADGQVDFVRDDQGNIVKSHLDAATLTAISQATNGFYQPLGATGEGLTRIYDAGIKTLPQQQLTSSLQRQAIERFQWPLALGLLLLALDPLVGTRRFFRTEERRRAALATANLPPLPAASKPVARAATTVVAVLVLAAAWFSFAPRVHAQTTPSLSPSAPQTTTSPSQPSSTPLTTAPAPGSPVSGTPATSPTTPAATNSASPILAEQLFRQGNYKAAAEAYGQAADANPQDSRFRYDEGASLYRSGDYAGAAQAFQQSLSANDLNLQQHAYYGMGDARYRVGQSQLQEDPKKTVTTWGDAVKDYQNALDLNPGDADASYNLNLLKKQLEELKKQLDQRQKQQQQQKNQQNQQNQNDQQNQQNQSQQQQNQQNQNNQQQNQQNQQNQQGQQGQQQNQQNQQGQQGQQHQQGQSGSQGQNQPQNQNSGSQQNQQGQQQNQQNQSGQQGRQPSQQSGGQPQNQQQGQSGSQGQNQQQNQNSGSQQNQQGQQTQQQNQQNQSGQQGQQGQQQNQQSGQSGSQGQVQQPNTQGAEPAGTKPGQQTTKTGSAAGGAASGDQTGENGNTTVSGPGVMTREEARQALDSLKNTERKLPVTNYDSNKDGAQESPDQPYKDW